MIKEKWDLIGAFQKEKLLTMQQLIYDEFKDDVFSGVKLFEKLNENITVGPAEFRTLLQLAVTCEMLQLSGLAAGMFIRVDDKKGKK